MVPQLGLAIDLGGPVVFLLVSRIPNVRGHAVHNLENFEANDQTCALNGLAIVIDGLLQAHSHILKLSISSEKCLYDFPYIDSQPTSPGERILPIVPSQTLSCLI
jgi:hypothetical protein